MPPTLILIRHAEGEHNNFNLSDPLLTELGRQQCRELRKHLQKECPSASAIEAIVSSPMRRALETTLLALDPWIGRGIKVEVDADWQENSHFPSDTGTPVSILKAEFPILDFSAVDPIYPSKKTPSTNPYLWTREAILARGQRCLRKLHARPEKVIAVVTHSAFLRTSVARMKFATADYRIFDFVESQVGSEVAIKEREETKSRGGGMGRSPVPAHEPADDDFEIKKHVLGEAAPEVPS